MASTSRELLAGHHFGVLPFWWPAPADYGKFYNCAGDNVSGTRFWRWLEAPAAADAETDVAVALLLALADMYFLSSHARLSVAIKILLIMTILE